MLICCNREHFFLIFLSPSKGWSLRLYPNPVPKARARFRMGTRLLEPRFFVHTRELKLHKQTWRPKGRVSSCLCFVLEIWIKIAVFRRLLVLGWWIKITRIFLSASKVCRSFQVWKRSNFSYASSYFSCATVWKCSVLTTDLLG